MLRQDQEPAEGGEALRIRREEELPVYEQLDDVRSRAVTLGKIADILYQRGELDEALRIRREDVLPVFEQLGDVRSLLIGRTNLAVTLLQKDATANGAEIRALLCTALTDAKRLELPEAQSIADIIEENGIDCSEANSD